MLWKGFQRPKRLEFERETLTDRFGRFYAQPFERGFGTTIGNALRRVLLSSVEGAAVTAVKIDGVLHEFSPIPGVVEDATDIILNIKQVPLKMHTDTTKTLYLRVEKAGEVKARDIQTDGDVEMLDAIEYFVFPNFYPWHGFGLPIVYRFRPNGARHDSCLLEVYLLAPRDPSQPMQRAPEVQWIGEHQKFADHPALGRLGAIFDQDYENIAGVWKGLHSTVKTGVTLGRYQESRIRHYHNRIDDFLNHEVTGIS